jgi:hypothetical protein
MRFNMAEYTHIQIRVTIKEAAAAKRKAKKAMEPSVSAYIRKLIRNDK